MRLKDDFILHNTGEDFVIIATGEATKNFNGIIKLNNMGGEIVSFLSNDISEEDIVKAIVEKYEVDYDTAKEDIKNILDSLKKAGVILDYMFDNFEVMLADSYSYLNQKVIRIGHMGENARFYRLDYTLKSLEKTLRALRNK